MKINLFGGPPSLSEFLSDRRRNVNAFINTLRHQQLNTVDIRTRLIEKMVIEPINIDFQTKQLTITHRRQERENITGMEKIVTVATFEQKVPFTGDLQIIQCRPVDTQGNMIFYGSKPKIVQVIGKDIFTTFEAWEHNQEQINNFGLESIGVDYYKNQQEINARIKEWNQSLTSITI